MNTLKISARTATRLKTYADIAHPLEISGFAWGQEMVTQCVLLEQVSTMAETELIASSITGFHFPRRSSIKVWWHAHPDKLFWSAQDERAIETLLVAIPAVYSIELNRKGEMIARYDIRKPRVSVELDIIVVDPLEERLRPQLEDEVASKVKMPTIIKQEEIFPAAKIRRYYDELLGL